MKQPTQTALVLATLVHLSAPANAAIALATAMSGPNAPSTTTDELTFAADVSTSDLLHGIQGTGGSWLANGSSPDGLNDGANGGDFDAMRLPALVGAAWARDSNPASFREFSLGTGANGLGFDITEIQSIAAWQGAGFSNQFYTVSVRFVGAATFTTLTTVDYQPFPALPANNGGSTKVNITDTTGVLAGGVEAIRFDILDTISNNGGGTVFREIDVFGVASIPEPSTALLIGLGGLALGCRRRVR